MKTISMLLALINSLAAGLVVAAALPSIHFTHPAASIWYAARAVIGASIIAAGILTWIAGIRSTNPGLVFITGLFLVALGTASGVWTVHVALTSGNVKDHMFLYGGSLLAQGAVSLWDLLSAARPPAVM